MSYPISECLISKATTDKDALNKLIEAMKINKSFGHFSIFPCQCDLPCRQPTQKEINELNRIVDESTKDIKRGNVYI